MVKPKTKNEQEESVGRVTSCSAFFFVVFMIRFMVRSFHVSVSCSVSCSVSRACFQAISDKFGPVSLVHFDSHFDTWDEYFGEKCTHGTPFKRVSGVGGGGGGYT